MADWDRPCTEHRRRFSQRAVFVHTSYGSQRRPLTRRVGMWDTWWSGDAAKRLLLPRLALPRT
jgi:hypothetical protein